MPKPTDFPPDPERVRKRYLELLDAHPDISSDALGRMAEEDELERCRNRYVDAALAERKP